MFLQLDRFAPDTIALIDDTGARMSYGQLVEHMLRPVDLPERSLVFALARNQVSYVAEVLALIEQGHVPLLISAELEPEMLKQLIEQYQPTACLVPTDLIDRLDWPSRPALPGYSFQRSDWSPPAMYPGLELLLSTSGSTGSPKLVRFAQGNMAANAANVAEVFGWSQRERPLISLPLNYVMGLNAMLAQLIVGATILLSDANIMGKDLWDFARQEQATNFTGVPISYDILLRLRPERMDLPHLTTFAQGGGKLSEKTYLRMAQLAKEQGWRFIPTYGTTETSARCAFLDPELALTKVLSIGRAIPNVRLSLIDPSGQPITTPMTEGELVVEGNNVSLGYATKRTDLALGDEFCGRYLTGDVAVFDEDGFFYIKGRTHRFIKMLGNRIGLDESEQIIMQRWNKKVVCIGQEDRLLILTDSPDDHEQLKMSLAETLKLHHSLFQVRQYDELPRSASGKIRYRELEKQYFGQ